METDNCPLFTIIVPVYMAENTLEQCIESVLAQTERRFELILIDDGSTDRSGEICDQYALDDSRIQVIHQINRGVSSARNAGLNVATAEYVVFVDSDDYLDSNYLLEFLNGSSDLEVSSFVIEDENKLELDYKNIDKKSYFIRNDLETLANDFVNGYFNYVWAKRFKRCILTENEIRFSEELNISEDTLFVVEYLSHAKNITIQNSHGYHYVKYEHETLTNRNITKSLICSIEKANNLIFQQLKKLLGSYAYQVTSLRISKLYRNYLLEITNTDSIDKDFLNYLFKQYWFRTVISRSDFFPSENWKYQIIVKSKSANLFYCYLKYKRKKMGKRR